MKLDSGLTTAAVCCIDRSRAPSFGRFAALRARISATVGFVRVAVAEPTAEAAPIDAAARDSEPARAASSSEASSRKVRRLINSPARAEIGARAIITPTMNTKPMPTETAWLEDQAGPRAFLLA